MSREELFYGRVSRKDSTASLATRTLEAGGDLPPGKMWTQAARGGPTNEYEIFLHVAVPQVVSRCRRHSLRAGIEIDCVGSSALWRVEAVSVLWSTFAPPRRVGRRGTISRSCVAARRAPAWLRLRRSVPSEHTTSPGSPVRDGTAARISDQTDLHTTIVITTRGSEHPSNLWHPKGPAYGRDSSRCSLRSSVCSCSAEEGNLTSPTDGQNHRHDLPQVSSASCRAHTRSGPATSHRGDIWRVKVSSDALPQKPRAGLSPLKESSR